ncbi:type II toxin-antitoxin system RelE/ParE family toxin [Caulobacter sp. S45]|uniref:type II toxin-antitoxin system RelE/ParE family toxin n=1 Tax=Caulobacter sp. S45 TaxID=1641861 RepID=UPI001575C995|nr:type II toxin-antitoxin system RelE/ParE family toxin [Caulobacter sp. S45]
MPPTNLYTVRLTASALRELSEIRSYIKAQGAPIASETTVARLADAVEGLKTFPHRGRLIGRDVREIVTVRPYIIRYRIRSDALQIIRIRHGARTPG